MLRALGGRLDVGDLDVGKPQRPLGRALDDAALEAVADLERLVRALEDGDGPAPPPAEEPGVEGAGVGKVAGMKLEVDEWVAGSSHGLHWLTTGRGRETHRSER